jgi:tetratricopeptide (TPR) repeat protein
MIPRLRSPRTLGPLACLLLTPAVAFACLWDRDTLKQEQARFPETLELITGKFLRHSKEFYQWRIQDRLAKLKTDPRNLAYLDDLAVAYEKVGDHAKAVETILKKEDIQPGLYETYSNLGTFYILAGEFEKGLPFIDKALAINPDAHFGREKYQKSLVKYAIGRMKDGKLSFPMQKIPTEPHTGSENSFGFQAFLFFDPDREERQNAVKGVLGMMRFANHENPLLLESLGDLLFRQVSSDDGKQLAARAYLKASYAVDDPIAKEGYRKLAERAIYPKQHWGTLTQFTLANVEDNFQKELAEAENWYNDLHAKELEWIRAGTDVEAEFDRLYAEEPGIRGRTDGAPLPLWLRAVLWMGGIVAFLVARTVRRRRRTDGARLPLWFRCILFLVGFVGVLVLFFVLEVMS